MAGQGPAVASSLHPLATWLAAVPGQAKCTESTVSKSELQVLARSVPVQDAVKEYQASGEALELPQVAEP